MTFDSMHRVIKSHATNFGTSRCPTLSGARLFEAFCAHTVLAMHCFDAVEPESLIYEGHDPGIDSLLIFINDRVISTKDEVLAVFSGRRSDNEAAICFIQAKTVGSWSKGDLNVFESAVLDFISDDTHHLLAPHLLELKDIFNLIIDNLGKVRGGKPSVACYFMSAAPENQAVEIENAGKAFKNRLQETGLFSACDVFLLGREKVVEAYLASTGAYDAKFKIRGAAPFPKSEGIEEGYAVVVNAKSFIAAVLKDQSGNLRRSVFEENVRDFIDFESSTINTAMRTSLLDEDKARRFGILNNGITIISPDVRLQSDEIFISNYQIVNGCQTSSVIFGELENVHSDTTLMVKIIETANQDIVDEIVESTNSQNKIEDHQFLARLDCVKGIERYFRVRGGDTGEALYFERRPNQFSGQNPPALRIFTIKELARCCGAMFFDRPDLSARYPAQLVEELSDTVFDKENREEIFYASAFAYYRLKILQGNQKINPIVIRHKWHGLMVLKYILLGDKVGSVKSDKIEKACSKIIDFSSGNAQQVAETWDRVAKVLIQMNVANRDDARRFRLNAELKQAALAENSV